MAKLNVTDLAGANLGEIDVADEVFAAPVKEHLLWEVVRYQRAARRAGTHDTKTRAEVHITGKKMTKQKGTGGARHGSRRANIFKGGGACTAPPAQVRLRRQQEGHGGRAALGPVPPRPGRRPESSSASPRSRRSRPRRCSRRLSALKAPKALVVDSGDNKNLRMSARNLATSSFLDVRGLNVYDILRFPSS